MLLSAKEIMACQCNAAQCDDNSRRIARAQLKQVVEDFGTGWCLHRLVNDPYADPPNEPLYHKWECPECWQSLLEEVR